ncbi:alpha-(1,3)-fucosyltransferase C-like isoform X2 [Trichoplusia ni]|uniref:Fucosyltransferase n=1 Tax=Trichoplusia ni TaxID=7111 RepID=A0A7E5W707_TRINI|nr:alpha-(1,3)-fucosyltransferase C-like isoform X2 [Trichoplusia ni]
MVYDTLKLVYGNITNALSDRLCYKESEYEAKEMPSRTRARCLMLLLRQMRSVKFFFLVSCTSFAVSLFWVQLAVRQEQPDLTATLVQEALENVGRDSRYKDVYRKTNKLPKDFKYILLWNSQKMAPMYYLGNGQKAFLDNNCSVVDCYVTEDRNFFGNDITKFDAIGFNGRNLDPFDLPTERSQHQKYIFFNMESADNYPICDEQFDGFFNWTATYRLDSDVPIPYLLIRDRAGKVVGPKLNMKWKEDMPEVGDEFAYRIENKTKAAAWFVSHCKTRNGRLGFAGALKSALLPYGYTVDVYGLCGSLQCPRNKQSDCDFLLKRDYFFYLALENSFDRDYVTEKLLTALQHDVVPILYGGADYSRFLPPGSYIDGRKQSVTRLAAIMDRLMHSPKRYSQYFRWKPYYTYHDPSKVENVCSVCEALHNKKKVQETTIYESFRDWWYSDYEARCDD